MNGEMFVFAYYFSFLYFFFVRAMSFHFWPLNNFMLFQRETIPINANKANKNEMNIITVETETTFTTQKTRGYKLQVYLEEKQQFFTFQFLFLFMVCIIVLMLSF